MKLLSSSSAHTVLHLLSGGHFTKATQDAFESIVGQNIKECAAAQIQRLAYNFRMITLTALITCLTFWYGDWRFQFVTCAALAVLMFWKVTIHRSPEYCTLRQMAAAVPEPEMINKDEQFDWPPGCLMEVIGKDVLRQLRGRRRSLLSQI